MNDSFLREYDLSLNDYESNSHVLFDEMNS